MTFNDFMARVRYWDTMTAKWIMRHFYMTFFQLVLVVIFIVWLFNTISVIDASLQASKESNLERILATMSVNETILVLLVLLNSFWMLFMFNAIQNMRLQLKDINYNTSRLKTRNPS